MDHMHTIGTPVALTSLFFLAGIFLLPWGVETKGRGAPGLNLRQLFDLSLVNRPAMKLRWNGTALSTASAKSTRAATAQRTCSKREN